MRIIKRIFFVLSIIILVIAAIGLVFFPSHIHITRSTTINQKQDLVFKYVGDLNNWNNWSPWYRMDTVAKFSLSNPASGVGATLSWNSQNKELGKGSLKIADVFPDSLIKLDIYSLDQVVAQSLFHFTDEGNATNVTWAIDANAGMNPLLRIMGAFFSGKIGKEFESGLSNLKTQTEALPVLKDSVNAQ